MTRLRAFKLEPAKVQITQEEILADLRYPARPARRPLNRTRGRRR